MINYMKNPGGDHVPTPEYAIRPLLPYIDPSWVCWECTDHGESKITKLLQENGNKVLTSHIQDNQNFLEWEPDKDYDLIITNPPYSIKTEFLARAYQLNKKFAMLLPITALESQGRSKIFREYDGNLEVLVFDKRVNFFDKKGTSIWFNTSWFCRNVLPKQLIFCELIK